MDVCATLKLTVLPVTPVTVSTAVSLVEANVPPTLRLAMALTANVEFVALFGSSQSTTR